jgi:hypothetical protein
MFESSIFEICEDQGSFEGETAVPGAVMDLLIAGAAAMQSINKGFWKSLRIKRRKVQFLLVRVCAKALADCPRTSFSFTHTVPTSR